MISGDRVRSEVESASSMEEAAHTAFLNFISERNLDKMKKFLIISLLVLLLGCHSSNTGNENNKSVYESKIEILQKDANLFRGKSFIDYLNTAKNIERVELSKKPSTPNSLFSLYIVYYSTIYTGSEDENGFVLKVLEPYCLFYVTETRIINTVLDFTVYQKG